MLPGYVETVIGKLDKVSEPYKQVIERKLTEELDKLED
jgi:hypothetical protein